MGRIWPWAIGAFIIWSVAKGEPESNQSKAELPAPKTIAEDQRLPFTVKPNTKPQPATKTVVALKTLPVANQPTSSPTNSLSTTKQVPVRTMYVDASSLHVRDTPDKTAKVVWNLKNNEATKVIGQSGEWLQVQGAKYSGWVFGTYLTAKPARAATQVTKRQEASPRQSSLSDANIKDILIKRSLSLYRGSCPCPYNSASNGSKCGKRSAYSRPGGASPLCYKQDVSNVMVADYRARQ